MSCVFRNDSTDLGQFHALFVLYGFDQFVNGFEDVFFGCMFRYMKKPFNLLLLAVCLFFGSQTSYAQTVPFENEVKEISARIDSLGWQAGETIFTGSSSVRMWKSLESEFPDQVVYNTGFGGSKASDLEKHLFPLVLRFEPKKVFIYEGDNDLWADVEVSSIMESLDNIVTRILLANPHTEVNLISAKPSPSRWSKKKNYLILNDLMRQYAQTHEGVGYVSVWEALLDSNGSPRPELYIEDQLHLNEAGYKLWSAQFKEFMED